MRLEALQALLDVSDGGAALHALVARLYPLCRSATGDGVRETLAILSEMVPLQIHEVPTGTPVLDWAVPEEWNVRDAYVKNSRGERVIDFQRSNLHVVGYSVPVSQKMSLRELKCKLHTLPAHPDWIPYRTNYFRHDWGFCLTEHQLQSLEEDTYEVLIDSTLKAGSLTYGELVLPGLESAEVLLSAHVCHPSLCNDNLSGISVAAFLARYLARRAQEGRPTRYTYRFLFAPATIGAITWLGRNEANLSRIRHGLVLTLLGDSGALTYKRSRRGDALIDRAAAHALAHVPGGSIRDFIPYGYDERQFCSPGFDLPVGCLMRTPHGEFDEYHTSADDLNFVKPHSLLDSLEKCLRILDILERDATYTNTSPKGEPQLGRRGLYRAFADRQGDDSPEMAILWVLNQSDGTRSLLDIATRSGIEFGQLADVALVLEEQGLLIEAEDGG
jgi:aminopeptidase-like protein